MPKDSASRAPQSNYTAKLYCPPAEPLDDDTVARPAHPFADGDPCHRAADARPSTWNPETLTFEAVALTPTPVARRDARGPFLEVLTADAVDLRGQPELPVFDNHRGGSARATIGVARDLRREGDVIVATIRLSAADDVEPIRERVADGTIRHVSIGYRVAEWREEAGPGGRRAKIATAMRITEISLVPDPADPAAKIRSRTALGVPAWSSGNPNNRAAMNEVKMSDETLETPTPEEAERTRRSEIRTLVRSAGLGANVADDLIDDDASVEEAKAAVCDAMQSRTPARPVIRTATASPDAPEQTRAARSEALASRAGLREDLPERAAPYQHDSMMDVARASCEAAGVSVRGMSQDEVLHRAAHTTSDFPVILQNTASLSAQQAFQYAQSPLMRVSRQMTVADFKPHQLVRLGEVGALQEVPESGEIEAVSRAETGESISVATYAARLDASRQLLINDSLGLFADMSAELGRAAAAKQSDLLHATLTSNPTLADGTPVFAAGRPNLVTDDLDDPALNAARKWFRTMRGLDGETFISAAPRYLVVGPDTEQDAEKLLASIAAATVATVNTWTDAFDLLVEPRMTGDQWFMFADPAQVAVLRHAYLSGQQGPTVQRQDQWATLGVSFRVLMDFGTAWTDWRAYKSDGTEV